MTFHGYGQAMSGLASSYYLVFLFISFVLIGVLVILFVHEKRNDDKFTLPTIYNPKTSSTFNSCNKPYIGNLPSIFGRKVLNVIRRNNSVLPTPTHLFGTHVSKNPNLNESLAEKMSENRGPYFKRISDKNTVFKDPGYFIECNTKAYVGAKTSQVYVPPRPVSTYQCYLRYDGWRAERLGRKWPVFEWGRNGLHFLRKSLYFDHVSFDSETHM